MKVCKEDFKNSKSNSILEYLEKKETNPDYACREGYCGVCKVKMEEGEVEYNGDPIAFLDDNEFLPCICTPKSNLKLDLG